MFIPSFVPNLYELSIAGFLSLPLYGFNVLNLLNSESSLEINAYSEFSSDSLNSNYYPEYEGRYRTRGDGGGAPPPSSGGKPPDGGGKPNGGGALNALQKLNAMAPQIASLLTNRATRPLLIKKKQINQIYPPLPTNTNLDIVQQAIARSEEDSSILNVYFV